MKNWVLALCAIALFAGCASAPKSEAYAKDMDSSSKANLKKFTQNDEALQKRLDSSAGYVIYPLIVKAGYWLGYGHGEGVVFKRGKLVAYTSVNDFNLGFQAGAHGFSQLIVFDDANDVDDFLKGNFEFAAGAGAVFFPWGLGVQTRIGRASVYLYSRGGLMFDATVRGQSYTVAEIK